MNSPMTNLFAVIAQWVLVIYSTAIYGYGVGMLILAAIFLNAVQAATQRKEE